MAALGRQGLLADFLRRLGMYGDGSLPAKLAEAFEQAGSEDEFVGAAMKVSQPLSRLRREREAILREAYRALARSEPSRTVEPPGTAQAETIMIATATAVETRAMIDALERRGWSARIVTDRIGAFRRVSKSGRRDIILVQTEVGSSTVGGSAVTLGTRLQSHHPSVLILAGIAFGVDSEEQSVGDVLVSQRVAMYEHQRIGTQDGVAKVKLRGPNPSPDPMLLSVFRAASVADERIRFGQVLSGEKLVDNAEFRESLVAAFPEAIGGEMEASGAYAAASQHRTPWILAKAICDFADGQKSVNKVSNQKVAAEACAEFVARVVTDLL